MAERLPASPRKKRTVRDPRDEDRGERSRELKWVVLMSSVLVAIVGSAAGTASAQPRAPTQGEGPSRAGSSASPNASTSEGARKVFAAPVLTLDLGATSNDAGRVLTLSEAIDTATRQQPSMRQARASTEVSVAKVDEASSPYYPQLTATASYARQTGNAVPRPGTFIINAPWSLSRTFNTFNAGITGTMMLYDFGQVRGKVHAAEASVDASKASEKNVGAQMVLAVRKAFFQARAQKALTKVATEVLENQKRHLAQVEAFVAVGTRPDIDLAQERTNIANARLSLLNARTNYELARAQLNQAMGIVATTGYEVSDDEIGHVEGEELGTDQLIAQAIAQRPDILALERQRDATQATLASLKASYAPTLAAQGSVTEGGIALDAMVPNWSLGVTLTWPIYQGGITRAQVRETEANVLLVQAQIDAIRLQVSVDIEQARLSVRSAKEGIDAATEVLASAREQLRLAEGRYKAGIGSVIELGDAQIAVVNASAQVIQAQYNLSTARAQLMLALGKS